MLCLSRFEDESIIIGNGLVKIKVLSIRGGRVRLGFEAPPEVSIVREEIMVAAPQPKEEEKDDTQVC